MRPRGNPDVRDGNLRSLADEVRKTRHDLEVHVERIPVLQAQFDETRARLDEIGAEFKRFKNLAAGAALARMRGRAPRRERPSPRVTTGDAPASLAVK